MGSTRKLPQSLFDAWNCYIVEVQTQQSERQAYATIARTKTAIVRYMLPYWGLPAAAKTNMTQRENEQALDFMKTIEIDQLQLALVAQDQVFQSNQVPDQLQHTYRAALNRFLIWCQKQDWFQAAIEGEPKLVKPSRPAKRSANDIPKRERSLKAHGMPHHYALGTVEGDVIIPKLQQELDEYRRFRLEPSLPSFKPVKPITVDRELSLVLQILGWLHRFRRISSDDLSLNYIFPYTEPGSLRAEDVARQGLALFRDYTTWLQTPLEKGGRGSTNKHYELEVIAILLNVARFVYRHEVSQNQAVPLIQALEETQTQRRLYHQALKRPERVAQLDPQEVITDWKEVLLIVEHLRAECLPRAISNNQTRNQPVQYGRLRSLTAIAHSYQKFLLFALMSYIPPDRPQVYRNLLIRQDDSIPEADVSGHLYQNGKHWYISLLQGSEPKHLIKIPNLDYPDGRCFYQYLKEWLTEYVYINQEGNHHKVDGLRQAFQPQHPYLFTKNTGEKYQHTTELSKIVRETSYRITGKTIAPDKFRYLFNEQIKQAKSDTSEAARRFAQEFVDSCSLFE